MKKETNPHVIKNMPLQLQRIRAAGENAVNNFIFPYTMRYRLKKNSFKRFRYI